MKGTLRMVHDGSYMCKVDPSICLAAFIITCISTGQKATGTLVEKSDFADNYRVEALGAIGGLLILRAATKRVLPYKECLAYCDNLGIIGYAKKSNEPLCEKQSQSDVIGLIKQHIFDTSILQYLTIMYTPNSTRSYAGIS